MRTMQPLSDMGRTVACVLLQTSAQGMMQELGDAAIVLTLKRENMATEVILSLPDHVYHKAARLAQLMQRDVGGVLADTITSALAPLGVSALDLTPVQELSDSALLAAADLRMDARQGKRLGHLLDRQQAGTLRETERGELAALMQVYHECLVRKAQAWHEAVRRGLRAPVAS